MRRAFTTVVSVVSFLASVGTGAARAQMHEAVGARAQGMGGAFTAVADDATATWWNPAGLAAGPYFNTLIEYDRPDVPEHTNVQALAMALPSLGLSYYRLPISQMRPATSTADASSDRQDQGYLSQFGATFGQSVGGHLVVATTLKLLHAGDTHGDLDAGALVTAGHLRFGVSVRNLRETSFGEGPGEWTLKRTSRAGVAFVAKGGGRLDEVTVAGDADLTRVQTFGGDERHVAAGAEAWLFKRVLGVRGGISGETVNSLASRSVGLSLMLQSGKYVRTYIDGQMTGGSDEVRKGWGGSLRVTF